MLYNVMQCYAILHQVLRCGLILRSVLKHLNDVLKLVCVKNVLVLSCCESAGNNILICQEIVVQGSPKFQVPSLSIVLCHLPSYTAVRYPTCQENNKLNLFHHCLLILVLPG